MCGGGGERDKCVCEGGERGMNVCVWGWGERDECVCVCGSGRGMNVCGSGREG